MSTVIPHRLSGAAQPGAWGWLLMAARTLGSRLVGGFLREGWFKGVWVSGSLKMQLHVPPWKRTEAELPCACPVNGREETVVFCRDERRSNVYRAALPVSAIVDRVEAILDIEMSPKAISRYRGQGIQWRCRGVGGLPHCACRTVLV